MELIEGDEFMDSIPAACHPLPPDEEFAEILSKNKLVLILKQTADLVQYEDALKKANAVDYLVIDLEK